MLSGWNRLKTFQLRHQQNYAHQHFKALLWRRLNLSLYNPHFVLELRMTFNISVCLLACFSGQRRAGSTQAPLTRGRGAPTSSPSSRGEGRGVPRAEGGRGAQRAHDGSGQAAARWGAQVVEQGQFTQTHRRKLSLHIHPIKRVSLQKAVAHIQSRVQWASCDCQWFPSCALVEMTLCHLGCILVFCECHSFSWNHVGAEMSVEISEGKLGAVICSRFWHVRLFVASQNRKIVEGYLNLRRTSALYLQNTLCSLIHIAVYVLYMCVQLFFCVGTM